ncbi:VacJ family lipoprotein [bacterium]|nr:VacJ family lipoprotein [bacterium]
MLSKNKIVSFALLVLLALNNISVLAEKIDIQAVQTENCKYPDYATMYVGEDKYEKFNRKMFNLNTKLNKYIARPVHILWSSVMPKYGMDRIKNAYNNIEYPKRLASCLLQRDGDALKKETVRFLTNSTIGLGGLFDPADKIFKIKPTNENMEQALCKCKMNSGHYMVMPVLNACTPRSLCGRMLEAALDPSVYLATPLTSIIKFGLMVNRTSYMQPLAKMIESTYADPYDIQKKLYGLENYIRNSNLDRKDLLETEAELVQEGQSALAEEMIAQIGNDEKSDMIEGTPTGMAAELELIKKPPLTPDIVLDDYNSQTPVIDSMRTALFDDNSVNKSMWNELSIWNRSFAKRIKTASISIDDTREPYKYRYILQKDKTAPLVIMYPSIGEGSNAHHSVIFAKMFYDAGYSVIIQGSHFHWEFVKSMPEGYCPGIPSQDADYIKLVTSKIMESVCAKYGCDFREKVVVGTSFGAMATLFVAEKESKNNTLGINKFIAISPPIELVYALEQLDKNSEEFDKNSPEVKHKTAITAAKILQLSQLKENSDFEFDTLPFTDEEGKLITTFILRQKLSDLIFTIENIAKNTKTDFYQTVNNMSYRDYAEKYLLKNGMLTLDDIKYETGLYSLADYLTHADNYKIYQSFDDYFINKNQLARLKTLAGKHLVCLNCGAHLGFLYRKEFIDALKSDIGG